MNIDNRADIQRLEDVLSYKSQLESAVKDFKAVQGSKPTALGTQDAQTKFQRQVMAVISKLSKVSGELKVSDKKEDKPADSAKVKLNDEYLHELKGLLDDAKVNETGYEVAKDLSCGALQGLKNDYADGGFKHENLKALDNDKAKALYDKVTDRLKAITAEGEAKVKTAPVSGELTQQIQELVSGISELSFDNMIVEAEVEEKEAVDLNDEAKGRLKDLLTAVKEAKDYSLEDYQNEDLRSLLKEFEGGDLLKDFKDDEKEAFKEALNKHLTVAPKSALVAKFDELSALTEKLKEATVTEKGAAAFFEKIFAALKRAFKAIANALVPKDGLMKVSKSEKPLEHFKTQYGNLKQQGLVAEVCARAKMTDTPKGLAESYKTKAKNAVRGKRSFLSSVFRKLGQYHQILKQMTVGVIISAFKFVLSALKHIFIPGKVKESLGAKEQLRACFDNAVNSDCFSSEEMPANAMTDDTAAGAPPVNGISMA
ncbi:hypothetical protein MMH89_04620 [Candidatus Comchoanobacter bicostacola]|uniref:Uncharacterized protein n=1 Tax=Candidatus Comchoanobacter bicostacola TaxID=2919598 RepID=A0ABY5DJM8_9GAMM|nr:hypothetical protein [Candidatus Comchoanobacter bicostacola]UTC24501.1 hypothetical protein MMH89_04620 [Candidatus Comchoanobacter bicostacola]